MKNNKRKIIACSLIFILVILLIIGFSSNIINIQQIDENIRNRLYGEPIDLESGIINNEYFNINKDGTNASETTSGINKALKYCQNKNIKNIRLQNGRYLINNSINMPSNINLNLDSSVIIMKENNETHYNLFKISNKENVEIKNGILQGDREKHDYSEDSTHEWGMGIRVAGSNNINIENLEIFGMTGDGIYITNGNSNSNTIKIKNCLIYNNRRQGISIISGEKIEICYNEIYKIKGTNPQSGVDLEANNELQKIDQVDIHNNNFYDFGLDVAIKLHSQIYNVKIRENTICGGIDIDETKEKTEIISNKLIDGLINIGRDSSRIVNNVEILNNTLENYKILHNDKVNNIKIEGNKEI